MHEGLLYNRMINRLDFIVVDHANMCFSSYDQGYRKGQVRETTSLLHAQITKRVHKVKTSCHNSYKS